MGGEHETLHSVWRAGFIGSEIVSMLEAAGQNVWVPPRDDESVFDTDLGTVIHSAGQGDCKNAPLGGV